MIRTVLFDLDGTIMDTNELIIGTFLHVLKDIVPPTFTREHIIPSMGQTLEQQLREFSKLDDVSHLIQAYRKYNLQHHDAMVKPFPYVEEVLQQLYNANIQLGVVTTKARLTTERALNMFHLYNNFGVVVTVDDVTHAKPHPEPVYTAMDALGANPSTTLMVGDSPADIVAANAAGAVSCAVAWSLKGEQVLQQYNPRHIIHDMRDLYAIVGLERNN